MLVIYLLTTGVYSGKAQQMRTLKPIDKGSNVSFTIRNFGVKTNGEFSGLAGLIIFDPASPGKSKMDVTVRSASIDTDNATRDKHLRQENYFDVAKFPTIRIQSPLIQPTNKPSQFLFTGVLTIKSVPKPVKFLFSSSVSPGGLLLVGEKFMINRRDFDVGGSSISLSDDVYVTISVYAQE